MCVDDKKGRENGTRELNGMSGWMDVFVFATHPSEGGVGG
jgi:ribosomal silencing factor RsfS